MMPSKQRPNHKRLEGWSWSKCPYLPIGPVIDVGGQCVCGHSSNVRGCLHYVTIYFWTWTSWRFCSLFQKKIAAIRSELDSKPADSTPAPHSFFLFSFSFLQWTLWLWASVARVGSQTDKCDSAPKSCVPDPVPTTLLKMYSGDSELRTNHCCVSRPNITAKHQVTY